MPIIGLVGPHAIGKSTALKRWCKKYPNLTGVSCDTGEAHGLYPGREKGWYKSPEECAELVSKYRGFLTILEGCAQRWHIVAKQLRPTDKIIHVTCSPTTLLKNMQERCRLSGKKFNEAYWTPKWLGYESSTRFSNFAAKNLTREQVETFNLDTYTAWADVDQYLNKLLIRVNHNWKNHAVT